MVSMEDTQSVMQRSIDQLEVVIQGTREYIIDVNDKEAGRSKAVAITHMETALLWLKKAQREESDPR
jgi:hypothetical protein